MRKKRKKAKSKLPIVILLFMIFISTFSFAYAKIDVEDLFRTWFNKKAEESIRIIEDFISLETEYQSNRIKEEIARRKQEAERELNQFTEQQKELYKRELEAYADNIINNLNISNEDDKRQIEEKLSLILQSAKEAMDNLASSYTPPQVIFVQNKIIELPVNIKSIEQDSKANEEKLIITDDKENNSEEVLLDKPSETTQEVSEDEQLDNPSKGDNSNENLEGIENEKADNSS